MSRSAPARLLGLLGLLAAAAAAPGSSRETVPTLPTPALEKTEPAVRRQLEEAQRLAARLLADPAADDEARGESVGSLCRLYLLYSLLDSAETCLEGALQLQPRDFRWSYYLAVLTQRLGRFDEAARQLETAIEARPADLPSLLRLGQVELARDRPAAAAIHFRRALELDPSSAAALYGLGRVRAEEGDLEAAVELFRQVLEQQPQASTAHYQLGLALRRLGDLEGARRHLARQGRSEVEFADPLMSRLGSLARGAAVRVAQAMQATGRGDLVTAQRVLESALEVDPDNLTTRLALATNLIRQDRPGDAARELEEVLGRDPENVNALYNLGTVIGPEEPDRAIALLQRAIELAPDFADAHVNLAGLLAAEDRAGEALAALERALELEAGDLTLQIQRAQALGRIGRLEEARATLARTEERIGGDAALLVLLAQAHEELAEPGAAEAAYRRALSLADQAAASRAALGLGLLLRRQGRDEDAAAALDRALELAPGWIEAHGERAVTRGRLGRFAEAARDFAAVIAARPRDPGARIGRAVALLLAEDYRTAATHLEESVAQLPGSVDLRHTLARLLAACPDPAVRDGERALALAQEVAARERNLEHGQTLAMALAENGRFQEAAALQQELLAFAERVGAEAALPDLRHRLASYRRNEPVRAPWLPEGR